MIVNTLVIEKVKKKSADLVIERSVRILGCTPQEKSNENFEWMRKNGYLFRGAKKNRRGTRGRPSKTEIQME